MVKAVGAVAICACQVAVARSTAAHSSSGVISVRRAKYSACWRCRRAPAGKSSAT